MIKQHSFTKMHGLGNDFMVINALQQPITLHAEKIQQLANRHIGIGFDQLLIIEPSQQADFFCRIFNSDGSEAEQCGNGLRCVARYLHENKLHVSNRFTIATKAGTYPVEIQNYQHINVTMGTPSVLESLIELPIHSTTVAVSILNLGNPHAVVKIDSLNQATIPEVANKLATHDYFNDGVNVGFMQIVDPSHIRLRTFERGAGETFACGSNACAAALAGMINGWLTSPVTVEFRYGSLEIKWDSDKNSLQMMGPAEKVYEGLLSPDSN